MKPNFKLQKIAESVCNHYGIEVKEIQKKGRKASISNVRQVFFYMANEFSQRTLVEIGDFCDRDHPTVIYSINKVRTEKEIYSSLRLDIESIMEKIFGSGLIPMDVDLLKLSENYSKTVI